MLQILDCDITREIRREEVGRSSLHRMCDLYRYTLVEQPLERSRGEPRGQYNVMGAWLWTLKNFICFEYCLCTAGFVQRQNATLARHLAVKVATGDFQYLSN